MAKRKKKSKGGAIAGGIAVLAVLGALAPADDQPKKETKEPPAAVVSEIQEASKSQVEELMENPLPAVSADVQQEPTEDVPDVQEQSKQEPPETPPEKIADEKTEVDPEQAFREKLLQYNYVSSSKSDKYHYPTCGWTKSINDSNLVHFETEEEAAAAGYVPCKSCNP